MLQANKREPILLVLGDLLALFLGLFLALALRNGEIPNIQVVEQHISPFSFIFAITILVFFIAGLYDKQRTMVKRRIPAMLFNAEIANTIIAIFFFYLIPYFGVAPKTLLFIYILLSLGLLFLWRSAFPSKNKTAYHDGAILIASGEEARELLNEINSNNRYGFKIVHVIDQKTNPEEINEQFLLQKIKSENISLLIVDTVDEKVSSIIPLCYRLFFSKIAFADFHTLYEEIFDRAPVSLLNEQWILKNIPSGRQVIYDVMKRIMDVIISLPLFVISLLFYPFIWLGNLFEGNKKLFSFQERVGQFDNPIKLIKFRTMLFDDNGEWESTEKNRVTSFGSFLRKTRLDEIPQLLNVLKGDVSLIGPRPEFLKAVKQYEDAIPYYSVRHMIKPGLSGWAQIYHQEHPHHGIDLKETNRKLSYDIYYIKHRSLLLDIIIALKTIRTLLSRQGK